MTLIFDHMGIPTKEKKKGMIYVPEFKLWYSKKTEFGIEWLLFDKDCPFHTLIQTIPHIAFYVKDLDKAIKGRKLLLEPCRYQNNTFAFFEDGGAVIELMQLAQLND